ncbi:hypothetical protein PMKS-000713 [Pichia membranifaciens]|uniref:DNA 3'-5' helicase n=1 Tax=Pichia membranifaciens TaxID=4926 RepID=A0A1Q2YCI5_9ASCO|nr:hypothetical protein PMKS-000713 [Pichia membranifaciens]
MLLKAINSLGLEDVKTDKSSLKRVQSYISQQKSLGFHPDDVVIADPSDRIEAQHFQVYSEYQKILKQNTTIDFDDILVYTYKLLTIRPECVSHVKHILVDEFQDTNTIQLKLIFKFTQYCKDNITIVGDADQSIYAFRNASYENFKILEGLALENRREFIKITLDQNYRSTDSILKISESLMRHQEDREDKKLVSNNDKEDPVYYICHKSHDDEPIFIADKISNMLNDTDNNYTPKDFAIIVRVSRTFLSLERELTRNRIPYRIVKGQSFWDLKEISMTVDCLRIIANDDWLAYKRTIDWFAIGCGTKLIEKIETAIFTSESSVESGVVNRVITEFATGIRSGASSKAKASLFHLLSLVNESRTKLMNSDVSDFFNFVTQKFSLVENSLKKKSSSKDDNELKYEITENLSELRKQLEQYNPEEDEQLRKAQEEVFQQLQENNNDAQYIKEENITKDSEENASKEAFLSAFLDHIYLAESIASDDQASQEKDLGKVTLTTIHGSKGLEWPVVILPSLVNNIIPSKFSLTEINPDKKKMSINEERRCFYVALTRSKDHLYLSTYHGDENSYQPVSPSCFLNEIPRDCYHDISPKPNNEMFTSKQFSLNSYRGHKKFTESRMNFAGKPSLGSSSYPSKPAKLVGANGEIYNPVTGALVNVNGAPSKKRRLGMGRPYKQLLPARKK